MAEVSSSLVTWSWTFSWWCRCFCWEITSSVCYYTHCCMVNYITTIPSIHLDPRQRSPVSHQMKITPSLRSHQRISSVQWHWVFCSSLTSRHAVVNISQRSLPPEYREREVHDHSARLLTGVPFWTNTSVDKWRSFMCSVITRRKAVGGKESCLTLHNMSSLASTGSFVNQYLDRFERFFFLYRYLQVSTQVCTTGGCFFPPLNLFLCANIDLVLFPSIIVSLPLPREEQSSTMLLREEMWRQLRDSSPLLSISTPGLRMWGSLLYSECVVSFLTQFIDCCSTGLCIPTTCRKDTLLYC